MVPICKTYVQYPFRVKSDSIVIFLIICKLYIIFLCFADYKYSESGTYYSPDVLTLAEFREFIESLPLIEEPEIFGMHENANIAFQVITAVCLKNNSLF